MSSTLSIYPDPGGDSFSSQAMLRRQLGDWTAAQNAPAGSIAARNNPTQWGTVASRQHPELFGTTGVFNQDHSTQAAPAANGLERKPDELSAIDSYTQAHLRDYSPQYQQSYMADFFHNNPQFAPQQSGQAQPADNSWLQPARNKQLGYPQF